MSKNSNIKVFALSTCGWCRKTINWLNDNDVKCEIVYTDIIIDKEEKSRIMDEVRQFNPEGSFPTIVIDGGKDVIVGFQPEIMKRKLR